jgi:ABC-2 type transport system permease protein
MRLIGANHFRYPPVWSTFRVCRSAGATTAPVLAGAGHRCLCDDDSLPLAGGPADRSSRLVPGEAVAGALYLFSAIFPLEVLPPFLRWIGYLNPVTYWLEVIRRALVGSVAEAYPTFANLTNAQLVGILAVLTLVFAVLSVFTFRWCEYQARERGLIDMVSNY